MRRLSGIALILFVLSFAQNCREAEAVSESPFDKEAQSYFIDYLKIDTSNPPGNETTGAEFLRAILAKEGIDAKLVGPDAARKSVWARLESGSSKPALLLMHHIDVVPVAEKEWSVAPFSGEKANGYIWGRGALDIKSLGIAHLMAIIDIKRRGVPLDRDIVFLGVADEETGGKAGVQALLERQPELFKGVGFVLNEGGANITVVDRIESWGIEVDQKVPLWLRLTAKGEGGHAAMPPPDGGATRKLIEAASAVSAIPMRTELHPSVETFFKSIAPTKPGKRGQVLSDPRRHIGTPQIAELPYGLQLLLRDTLVLTRLEAGTSTNAVPDIATADVDIRLLPGSDPSDLIRQVKQVVGSLAEVEVLLSGPTAPASPVDTELYTALEKVLRSAAPKSKVGPMVSAGTTDSRYFRRRGIVAYGFSPFKVNYYDGATVHGSDERIRIRFFLEGVALTRQIVSSFCARKAA
ncbi:MAG: M20/M25/M40 family metallo-hydrolase [Acidobacteria bacterium]|nr:M20/M25/M40 family metallo-hydrolase [Acidobacteriota bacterium]